MPNLLVNGFCLLLSASVIALLAMSSEFFIGYVNDILVPCQHDSVWSGEKCVCDNTRGVFQGQYCEECQCKHFGMCSSVENGASRWGCRCPSHQKWVGTLCDKCYATQVEDECSGDCMSIDNYFSHHGPRCNKICMPDASLLDPICSEVSSGGGECNACNGHGSCTALGDCDCELGWFTSFGGDQCSMSCADAGLDCNNGGCVSIGGELQCVCNPGYYGPDCDLFCGGENGIPCSGHGTCDLNGLAQPVCTCTTHFVGENCSHACPGDQTYPAPCTGHGTCSVENRTALCTCREGSSWDGYDCSCNPQFTCTGHGTCKYADSSCQCVDTDDGFESHFDGGTCALCLKNWYGENCHLYCDASRKYEPDLMTDGLHIGCNGHGTCELLVANDIEHITCTCSNTDPDFFCAKCVPDYYPLISITNSSKPWCSAECSEQTCSNRGKCNIGYDGSNDLCVCDTVSIGTVTLDTIDPKQYCSTCKPNWYPTEMESSNKCSHYCAADGYVTNKHIAFETGSPANPHDYTIEKEAENVCVRAAVNTWDCSNATFTAATCVDANYTLSCSDNISPDEKACLDSTRFSPDADCRVCSAKGMCRGDGECECTSGTTGVYCEIDCKSEDGTTCSGNGRCIRNDLDMWFDPFTSQYRCECTPYDTYTSETRQRLAKRGFEVPAPTAPHFYGKFCEFHCPRYNADICAGRGDCATGVAVDDLGQPQSCTQDSNCSNIDGGFCARLSTPWDSLVADGTSFFKNNGAESAGYHTCGATNDCVDAIYSVEWDNFCVNMLRGWYPSVLNTAQCTYNVDNNCLDNVEAFFTDLYAGDDTWCEAAVKALTPEGNDRAKCNALSFRNKDEFEQVYVPLCHTYSIETTCNAQESCIFDQSLNHIRETDRTCEDSVDCVAPCRMKNNVCITDTYCRAKTCQDIMYENNVEYLCLDIEPACPVEQDWSDFCAEATAQVRPSSDNLNTMDTFYSCYMFQNRHNPQLVEPNVPGGVDINGLLRVLDQDIPVRDFRKRFIDSRIVLDSTTTCGKALMTEDISSTDFCTKHLENIVPSWFDTVQLDPSWFREWYVVCGGIGESIHLGENEAYRRIETLGLECEAYYKSIGSDEASWDGDEAVDATFKAYPWTLKCRQQADITTDKVDYSLLPAESSGCRWEPNEFAQRWGQRQWSPYDAQDVFATSCSDGLAAPWIQIEKKIPTLCDMGACAIGDTCTECPDNMCNNGVFCESESVVNCFETNKCQNGGKCFQLPSIFGKGGYICEWDHDTKVTVVSGSSTFEGQLTPRGILTVFDSTDLSKGMSMTVNNNTHSSSMVLAKFYRQAGVETTTVVWAPTRWTACPNCPKLAQNTAKVVPDPIELCDKGDYNWYEYCLGKTMGVELSTMPGDGLKNGWSGTAFLLAEKKLNLEQAVFGSAGTNYSLSVDIQHSDSGAGLSITCDGDETIWYVARVSQNASGTREVRSDSGNSLDIIRDIPWSNRCQFVAILGNVVLKSARIGAVEQIVAFNASLIGEHRAFAESDAVSSGYKAWSFTRDGVMSSERHIDDVLPQADACPANRDGSCISEEPPRGVRWHFDGSAASRVHGWAQILDTSKEVANMAVMNKDLTAIVSIYIKQKRLYVNDVKTNCVVSSHSWWHWKIDTLFQSEVKYVNNASQTMFDQSWSAIVSIDDCVHHTLPFSVQSGAHTLHSSHKIAAHFREMPQLAEEECQSACHGHVDCLQWAWTREDRHCYLHSKHCASDSQCMLGAHTVHSLHSHTVSNFEIYSKGKNTRVFWSNIRAEPILAEPFTCPQVNISERVPDQWQAAFEEQYEPFVTDATAVCNAFATVWTTMPGYEYHQGGTPQPHDIRACATHTKWRQPAINIADCRDEKEMFLNLDWTSYCHYERSFEEQNGVVSFLGGVAPPMTTMCSASDNVRVTLETDCSGPVPSAWFRNCFERATVYEDFCSDDCIEHIESMLENADNSTGMCQLRKTFLDLSTNGEGVATNFDTGCNCDMNNLIITDFCLMQTAYHDGQSIRIPELANSACLPICTDTLKETLNRTEFKQWCSDLSRGTIGGICSKTVCDCDTTDHPGVAGPLCELDCPTGVDDGKELACSGRNGRCFAADESQREGDTNNQQINNEFRKDNNSIDFIPTWISGPSPTMVGLCQCALGSGIACSIPCDSCNNGTYGFQLASQYGICDSFNGICRALPPFMRFNVRYDNGETKISYNTTAFASVQGVSVWQFPERFLFEDDSTILKQCLRSVLDPGGIKATTYPPSSNIDLTIRDNIHLTLGVFRKLCWDKTTTNFQYLNNDEGIEFGGLDMANGTKQILKTTVIDGWPQCKRVPIGPTWYICFENGKMHAFDTKHGRMNDYATAGLTDESNLLVIETGNHNVPPEGMSFAVRDENTVYAFGGQRRYAKTSQQFNNMYSIDIRREKWYPVDIVFVHWSLVVFSGGRPPPAQVFAPMFSFDRELFLLGLDHTLYRLRLPTTLKVGEWSVTDSMPSSDSIIAMDGADSKLFFYGPSSNWTFGAGNGSEWATGAPDSNVEAVFVLTEGKQGLRNVECEIEFANSTLKIGGNVIGTDSSGAENVILHLEEWTNMGANNNIIQRFANTVLFYSKDEPTVEQLVLEAMPNDILEAVDLVDRIYMHQARWSLSSSMPTKAAMFDKLGTNSVRFVPHKSVEDTDFIGVFTTMSPSLFSSAIVSDRTKIHIATEGKPQSRTIVIMGNFEKMENYNQQFSLDGEILVLEITWNTNGLEIDIRRYIGSGSVKWEIDGYERAFVIIIPLENWIYNPGETFSTTLSETTGWKALFNLFVLKESTPTYSMLLQTSKFLEYSPSHCSITASDECPGLMPYVKIPCSGRGRCNIACQCVCEVAPSVLEASTNGLQNIREEDSPWRGNGCQITCPGYDGNDIHSVCSGRGTCQRDGRCSCPQGYTGESCQFKCPVDDNNVTCAAHGGCGTKAFEANSFTFVGDTYLDGVHASNKFDYISALNSFYGQCDNFVEQIGTFPDVVKNIYPSFYKLSDAKLRCLEINIASRTVKLMDSEFRLYPYELCLGIREDNNMYYLVHVVKPKSTFKSLKSIIVFECDRGDCEVERATDDDFSIANIQSRLVSPSFEFILSYEHGVSSGTVKYLVNGNEFLIELVWNTHRLEMTLGNNKFGYDTFVYGSVKAVRIVVEAGQMYFSVYKSHVLLPNEPTQEYSPTVLLAPKYDTKYREIREEMQGQAVVPIEGIDEIIISKFEKIEYICDITPTCHGILQWDQPFRESWFSMYTTSYIADGISYAIPPGYTYLKKMSLVYAGRRTPLSNCEIVKSGMPQYPTVGYIEKYDVPIVNLDISLAKDEDTDSVVIGSGLWTKCWKRGVAKTKKDCRDEAEAAGFFGFAWSSEQKICIIYNGIGDSKKIKLGRYNSVQRLTLFHPCNDNLATWREL